MNHVNHVMNHHIIVEAALPVVIGHPVAVGEGESVCGCGGGGGGEGHAIRRRRLLISSASCNRGLTAVWQGGTKRDGLLPISFKLAAIYMRNLGEWEWCEGFCGVEARTSAIML